MRHRVTSSPSFRWLSLALVLFVSLLGATALAAGRVQWGSTSLKERSDKVSWKVDLTIVLPKPPDFANMPMKFEFLPTVYYERSMVDGDKLQTRNVPLVGRQPIVLPMDVGFLDPGTGKIEKGTRFSFKLTRDAGFEAGEYKVTIRDGRSGSVVGSPTNLTLNGENEVIDRRAMVFSGGEKKKKPAAEGAAGAPAADSKSDSADSSTAAAPTAKESEPSAKAEEPAAAEAPPSDDASPPAPVEGKPGGCGCRAAGQGDLGAGALLALATMGVLVARRRRAAV